MFCNHEWNVLSETVTKSKLENSIEAFRAAGGENFKLPRQLCCAERKHIQIINCTKCGKIKRYVEDI
jgi:hypothetical protein